MRDEHWGVVLGCETGWSSAAVQERESKREEIWLWVKLCNIKKTRNFISTLMSCVVWKCGRCSVSKVGKKSRHKAFWKCKEEVKGSCCVFQEVRWRLVCVVKRLALGKVGKQRRERVLGVQIAESYGIWLCIIKGTLTSYGEWSDGYYSIVVNGKRERKERVLGVQRVASFWILLCVIKSTLTSCVVWSDGRYSIAKEKGEKRENAVRKCKQ